MEYPEVWSNIILSVSVREFFFVVVVQSLSRVQFFATPWTVAC